MLILGVLPTLPMMGAGLLLGYDDNWGTTHNPVILDGWAGFWRQLIRPLHLTPGEGFETGHWSPLSFLSLAFDHWLFGKAGTAPESFAPWAFRLSSGLYHGLCGWLVFLLGKRLLGTPLGALGAAWIFLFHPTVCESVCWVIERNNVLPVLLGLTALYVYTGQNQGFTPSWPRTLAAFGLLLAAQLCKASGISWWPVIVAWDFLLLKGGLWSKTGRALFLLIPVILSATVLLLSHADVRVAPLGEGFLERGLFSLALFGRYLELLIWPVGLSAFYHISPLGVDGLRLALAMAGMGLLLWAAIQWGIPWRHLLLYLISLAAALGPVINPFTTTVFLIQDRYLYPALPALGWFLFEFWRVLIQRWPSLRLHPMLPTLGMALAALFLALLRAPVWTAEACLYADACQKQPETALAHVALGRYLFWMGRKAKKPDERNQLWATALRAHERATQCDDYERTLCPHWSRYELGMLLHLHGRTGQARQIFRQILEGRPEWGIEKGAKLEAIRFLAFEALAERKEFQEGLDLAESGLRLQPEDPEFLLHRLNAWFALNLLDQAQAEAHRLSGHPLIGQAVREALERHRNGAPPRFRQANPSTFGAPKTQNAISK